MSEGNPDVVIIGGGLAGAIFALLLVDKQPETHICLIERFNPEALSDNTQDLPYDVRSLVFSEGSRLFLADSYLWKSCFEPFACLINTIEVSEKGRFGTVVMDANEEQVPALGYVVESAKLGQALWAALKKSPNIDFVAPAEVTRIDQAPENGYRVTLNQDGIETSLQPELVVLADGGKSSLLEQVQLGRQTEEYDKVALVSALGLERPHQERAYQRFDRHGPMALLPLTRMRAGFVWSVAQSDADELMALSDDEFLSRVQDSFGYRAGRFRKVGKRTCYPLVAAHAEEQVKPGLMLLGNVAHTLHPVAGQGFNLTLRDMSSFFESLQRLPDVPLGSETLLTHYQDAIRTDQSQTQGASDSLVSLFTSEHPLVQEGRQLGRLAIGGVRPFRKWLARRSMGLSQSSTREPSA